MSGRVESLRHGQRVVCDIGHSLDINAIVCTEGEGRVAPLWLCQDDISGDDTMPTSFGKLHGWILFGCDDGPTMRATIREYNIRPSLPVGRNAL